MMFHRREYCTAGNNMSVELRYFGWGLWQKHHCHSPFHGSACTRDASSHWSQWVPSFQGEDGSNPWQKEIPHGASSTFSLSFSITSLCSHFSLSLSLSLSPYIPWHLAVALDLVGSIRGKCLKFCLKITKENPWIRPIVLVVVLLQVSHYPSPSSTGGLQIDLS